MCPKSTNKTKITLNLLVAQLSSMILCPKDSLMAKVHMSLFFLQPFKIFKAIIFLDDTSLPLDTSQLDALLKADLDKLVAGTLDFRVHMELKCGWLLCSCV